MKRKILIILAYILVLLVGMFIKKANAEAPLLTKEELYELQLDQWVSRLIDDESNGNELVVVLDTNNKYSYGCLQYQMDTWISAAKKFGVDAEIMDCDAQVYVTKELIKDNYKNWQKWYTSVTTKTSGKPPLPVN